LCIVQSQSLVLIHACACARIPQPRTPGHTPTQTPPSEPHRRKSRPCHCAPPQLQHKRHCFAPLAPTAANRRCKLPRPYLRKRCLHCRSAASFSLIFLGSRVVLWGTFPARSAGHSWEHRSDEVPVPRCIRRLQAGFVKARSRGTRRRGIWVRGAVFAGFGVRIWGRLRVSGDLLFDRR
jgi:hypothetical protein